MAQAPQQIMFLDYFALYLLCFVGIVLFYGIIVIHDIPYEIAEKRDHPHQDAIHVAGWVSLLTLLDDQVRNLKSEIQDLTTDTFRYR